MAIELLVLRSPQFSFYARTAEVRSGTSPCRRYASFSPTSRKGWQHHLSQNIGPAIAGSAGPVPPPLCVLCQAKQKSAVEVEVHASAKLSDDVKAGYPLFTAVTQGHAYSSMGRTKFTTSGAHDVIAITSPQKNDLCTEELRDRAKSLDGVNLPLREARFGCLSFM